MKYRKKPVVIEAIIWTGANLREIIDFTGLHKSAAKWTWEEYVKIVEREGLKIFTLEGPMVASVGDYIIRGVKGEFYACRPDIFAMTYESVEPTTPPQEARDRKDADDIVAYYENYPAKGWHYAERSWCEKNCHPPFILVRSAEWIRAALAAEGKK